MDYALMYTAWNWVCVAAYFGLRGGPAARLFVQGNSLLVLLAVCFVHLLAPDVLPKMLERQLGVAVPRVQAFAVDAVAHWLPVALLGIPVPAVAPVSGVALLPPITLLLWYALVRPRIADVYLADLPPALCDRIVAYAIAAYVLLLAGGGVFL